MPASILTRPSADEYAPYYERYISRVPAGDLVTQLDAQAASFEAMFRAIPESRAGFRYATGKWSLREVVGHLIDTERVFTFRAISFARGDQNPLPSFDQDAWIPPARFDERTLHDLMNEWATVRAATIAMVRGLPENALTRRGTASGVSFTVLALLHIPPGHLTVHQELARTLYGIE
ncbi:MAG: DinB family protein [Gemmatimonadetes bacterium]|nr:DinB family protein [Gemmatimonadota bacterium]